MSKRIVILSAFLTPFRSGAEACAEEVALALSDRHEFTIITARMRRSLPRVGQLRGRVPVIRVGFGLPIDKWLFPFLAPFAARRLRPQIIHAVLETFAGLALHFCRFIVPSAKRVLTLQTTNRSFLKRLIVRSPHAVTAISSVLADFARKCRRTDIALIPNGIPLRMIRDAVQWHPKIPGRILFVGRLEPMKGVDILLQAFTRALTAPESLHLGYSAADALPQQAHIRIIGAGSQRLLLEQAARKLGIADRVAFMGYVSAPIVYDEFAQAEVFCGLSRSEALGNVFLEAQAAGCAVLGTNVGGIPDIVDDGVTGILVPPGDIDAAARALLKLFRDASFRSYLSHNGQAHAAEYDWRSIAERYEQVYRSV